MDAYEKIIKIVRNEGGRNYQPYPVKLAVMTANNQCAIGTLELLSEDLMIAEHLKGELEKGDNVLITRIAKEKYAIIEKVVDV